MNSITKKEAELEETLNLFDDPMMLMEYVIDLGREMPTLAAQYHTEDYIIKGCQSKVWMHSYEEGGRVWFEADSNTVITKGIIAILVKVLSGERAEDIVQADMSFIDHTGLRAQLSEQRNSGLNAMIKQMKLDAAVYGGLQK